VRVEWSHDWWRHGTLNVKVMTRLYLKINILKTVQGSGLMLMEYLYEST